MRVAADQGDGVGGIFTGLSHRSARAERDGDAEVVQDKKRLGVKESSWENGKERHIYREQLAYGVMIYWAYSPSTRLYFVCREMNRDYTG